ncbi:hypothetical protein CKO14_05285 [Halorhodospira halophila]|nr:hypothetical protein [Halorhodospira halophila]
MLIDLLKKKFEQNGYFVDSSSPYKGKTVDSLTCTRAANVNVYRLLRSSATRITKPVTLYVAIVFWFYSISRRVYRFRHAYNFALRALSRRTHSGRIVLEDTPRTSILPLFLPPVDGRGWRGGIHRLLHADFFPDAILVIDLPPDLMRSRVLQRERPGDKHSALDESTFIDLANAYKKNINTLTRYLKNNTRTTVIKIDGTQDIEAIANSAAQQVLSRLRKADKNI